MNSVSKRIGPYELKACLGRGSTSEIWHAYDYQHQRPVAIKLLATDVRDNPEYMSCFVRETSLLSSLHHPNIVRLQDARVQLSQRTDTAMAYLVTDYIEGPTLVSYGQSIARSGKLPNDIVRIFASISMAIDHAHQHGIIHGNLKPGNIFLQRSENGYHVELEPVVTDFGISRLIEVTSGKQLRRSLEEMIYVSPEQARGGGVSKQSDIYTLGILLYEICTGVVPFQGKRPVALLMQHVSAPPPSPSLINPNIPPALAKVILRCLEKDPGARFPSASAMVIALAGAFNTSLPERFSYHVYPVEAQTTVAEERQLTPASIPVVVSGRQGVSSAGQQKKHSMLENSVVPRQPVPYGRKAIPDKRRGSLTVLSAILAIVVVMATLGVVTILRTQPSSSSSPQPVGHVFFLNSGQLNEHMSDQGVNDEVQIDLSSIPDPSGGKAYYAWLLPDKTNTEGPPVLLGKMPVVQNKIHFMYNGGSSHKNLLAITSRFLITEEDVSAVPTLPSTDTTTWRYYAELAQVPSTADKEHFSMLDHFRHLLVDSPELQKLNLHGGLAIWLLQNTQKVFNLSTSARDAWQGNDIQTAKNDIISMVDYLDGKMLAAKELPDSTPFLADENDVQIPLQGRDPTDTNPSYGTDVPVGYVYLIGLHLGGAASSPNVTAEQRKLAAHINTELTNMNHGLDQMHTDAKQLLGLSENDWAQASTLTVLNDIVGVAQNAYTGRIDQASGQSQGGAIWIYNNIQRLVNFTVTPYTVT